MARNNRSRKREAEYEPLDVERLTTGWRRTEVRSGLNATKSYTCPGCSGEIIPGVSHLVAWRNDGILGDQADLEARRHWHEACWKVS